VAATLVVAVAAGALVLVRHVRIRREGAARAEQARAGRPVTVVRPERTPARRTVQVPGETHGYIETLVYAKIAGYLRTISVDKGDRVKTGDRLAELESPELDHQVQNARANYDLKRVTDARFAVLRRDGIVSLQDADQAHADFLQAGATLATLEAMQQYKHIVADFDGVVTARYVDPGTLIPQTTAGTLAASTAIVAMATLHPLRVYADLPEAEAPFVKDGDEAVVTVAEYPGRRFPAAVTRHPQALATSTRTLRVEVDLPNEDALLIPGMYVQVAIEVSGRTSAPRVPDDVLVFRDGKIWVPVVDDGKVRVVPVTLGYDDGRLTEVTEGLTGDELIAMNLGQTARDGEPVVVHQLPEDHAAGHDAHR